MSGQKQLEKACNNNRCVAMPSKKRRDFVLDENGQPLKDKNGEVVVEKTQLYNIHKMR